MKIQAVCFANPLELPDGSMGRMIRSYTPTPGDSDDKKWLTITKEGDLVAVRGFYPGNTYSGHDNEIEIHYNWAVVAWVKPQPPAPVATTPKK